MDCWRMSQDFNPTTSTSALIFKLKLQSLEDRRAFSTATFMYEIMSGLVHLNLVEGTLTTGKRLSQGQPKNSLFHNSELTSTFITSFPPPWECGTGSHLRHCPLTPSQTSQRLRWGYSSVGKASDWHAADAGSTYWGGKGFFSQSAFSADFLTVSVQPACAIAYINICAHVKDPKHWHSYLCLDNKNTQRTGRHE